MKKLEEIAETDSEKEVLKKLVADIRSYTNDSLKVLKAFENQKRARPEKVGFEEQKLNLDLQRKVNDNLYELFQRMHRIVDFPSFVILEDELKKQYQK